MLNFGKLNYIFGEYPYIVCAYLFGSYATGRESPMSDVDIAVLSDEELAPKGRELLHEIDYLSYRIATCLHVKDVDVVGLNNKGHAFAHNVLKTGKLIYDANPDKRIKFAVKVISYYCDFQPTIKFLNKYYFAGYRRRLRAI
jgi:predicted nucleotidyltransferase